ncbi:flavodoxin [Vibrio sp. HN007]|uniref:flavodoxin n=1 Tax=Vibrio iocasae TaxID=3098914 RepID=UPI0035D47B66
MSKTESRRNFIKAMAGIAATTVCGLGVSSRAAADGLDSAQIPAEKILILYFSQTGRTRYLANEVHRRTGGQMVEIKTVIPYKGTYDELTVIAKAEQRRKYRPDLATAIPDLAQFDTVLLGFPTWWSTMPMAMFTLLEQYDFSGKTLIPFVTHGGSGLARAPKDIRAIYPNNTIPAGLAIYGDDVKDSYNQTKINDWLDGLGLLNLREV